MSIQNLTSGHTVEHDFGFTTMDVQEAIVLREGVRTYTSKAGQTVEQECLWLQGVTSVPKWNKAGSGGKPSYHFHVHVATQDGETEAWSVSAFGEEVVSKLRAVLDFRQAFVRLKKVDVRHGVIRATMGPREGLDIPVRSLSINFINQIDILAVFAPLPSAWAVAAEALSKQHEGKAETEEDSLPF